MNLFDMDLFIEAVKRYLELNQSVRIVREGKELTWEPAYENSPHKELESLQTFSDYVFERVRIFDFRSLNESEFYKIRNIIDLFEQLIQDRKKKYPKEGEVIIREAEHKLMALRLGGRVDYRDFQHLDPELLQFLQINKFDKKCFTLGLQLSEKLAIPFEIEAGIYQEFVWKNLERQECEKGYRFFYKDQLLMETDLDYRLKQDFVVLYRGITFYHPIKALHIAHVDKRNPIQWDRTNWIDVVRGDEEAFILLRKEEGEIYCVGVSEGKLSSPVEAYFERYLGKYSREITKKELESILEVLQKHKYYKKSLSEMGLLKIIQETLGLMDPPKKPLVTKNKLLSYITLPYALWKFYRRRKEYPDYQWRHAIFTPYKVCNVDRKGLQEWIG